ncbi:cobalamin biosynthesis protein CobQ [Actibacterium mucosum]|uniref:cobalamin biosynthesis protein CobQ n=1 Tax=Actibacterium mucosum TaxID=1087332 RepID=UPI001F189D5F|nr:cobalamin biosynthesis protein CobQ [Actibacterium mucosum]
MAAGALLPDLSLYALSGWALLIRKESPEKVFNERYFSDEWQQIFAVDNSFVLWSLLLFAALFWRAPVLIAFAGAGIVHLLTDFPLHNDDARRHFWPLSNWVFYSPVSYWDNAHHAGVVRYVESAICAACGVALWLRHHEVAPRVAISVAMLLTVTPTLFWSWVFS